MQTGDGEGEAGAGIQVDVKKFEELFCIVPGDQKKPSQSAPKLVAKNQFKTLLDLRRAQNISIGLARYTRKGLTTVSLAAAIRDMDENILSIDDLATIQNLLPTPEERQLLELYEKTPREEGALPLAPAEQFLLDCMKQGGGGTEMERWLKAFLFRLQLNIEVDDIRTKVEKMHRVVRNLRKSEKLKILLRTVLELGNLTNYQYSAGGGGGGFRPWMGKEARALGFKIDGLARLKDVKSADGKWSLMNFLVDMCFEGRPEVLDLVKEEFGELKVVRHFDVRDLAGRVCGLEETLEGLRRGVGKAGVEWVEGKLKPLLEGSERVLEGLRGELESFAVDWRDAAKYLGEDVDEYATIIEEKGKKGGNGDAAAAGKKQPSHVFMTLDLFFQGYEDAVGQHRRRRDEEERRKKREIAKKEEKERKERLKREREAREAMEQENKDIPAVVEEVKVEGPKVVIADVQRPVELERKPSVVQSRKEEAKEMMKRFSVMQLNPPDLDGEDDDTDVGESPKPSPDSFEERDLDDEEGVVGMEVVLEENDYGSDVEDDGERRGRERDPLARTLGVCDGCFMPLEDCEC
ncbi:hypothetical protein HK097_011344 [Rhizophlyctis rosea]|uniref:FH2 domain-containing protein n=1 Tax=Rhizophlyctis rosea TaxID=64517 RepID=A0AAD5S9B3_9FUNG|nr:hypothetical protein HK097_011344 [Rhizophlyctis rosea]